MDEGGSGLNSEPPVGPASEGEKPAPSRLEQLQRLSDKTRSETHRLMARAEASRGRFRSVDAVFQSYTRDRATAGSLLAGALAYRIFLVMLPLLLVLIAGLGLGQGTRLGSQEAAKLAGLIYYAADVVKKSAGQSLWNHLVALSLGLFGLYFASRSLMKALKIVHLLAWGMQVQGIKTSVKQALATMGFVTIAFLISAVAKAIGDFGVLGFVGALAFSVLLYFGIWMFLSLRMPHPAEVSWTELVPGAALFAIGGQIIQAVTVFYLVGKAAHFSDLYGGLGVAAILLLWLYLIGRLAIAGVMLNATLWEKRKAEAATPSHD
jgi:uncharacterized BrkB/YihY/UPF0761 family membrane protein